VPFNIIHWISNRTSAFDTPFIFLIISYCYCFFFFITMTALRVFVICSRTNDIFETTHVENWFYILPNARGRIILRAQDFSVGFNSINLTNAGTRLAHVKLKLMRSPSIINTGILILLRLKTCKRNIANFFFFLINHYTYVIKIIITIIIYRFERSSSPR
jgi:hypothetical protein